MPVESGTRHGDDEVANDKGTQPRSRVRLPCQTGTQNGDNNVANETASREVTQAPLWRRITGPNAWSNNWGNTWGSQPQAQTRNIWSSGSSVYIPGLPPVQATAATSGAASGPAPGPAPVEEPVIALNEAGSYFDVNNPSVLYATDANDPWANWLLCQTAFVQATPGQAFEAIRREVEGMGYAIPGFTQQPNGIWLWDYGDMPWKGWSASGPAHPGADGARRLIDHLESEMVVKACGHVEPAEVHADEHVCGSPDTLLNSSAWSDGTLVDSGPVTPASPEDDRLVTNTDHVVGRIMEMADYIHPVPSLDMCVANWTLGLVDLSFWPVYMPFCS